MPLPLFQIDAFTAKPFAGNPAGVCLLDGPADASWMQAVAAEMNLSETAFLLPRGEAWHLRWFTPTTEVNLCGHATLAAAHALWESGQLAAGQQARFDTLSGRLTCAKRGDWIEMDFPADPSRPAETPPGLADALGAEPVAVFLVGGAMEATWLIECAGEAVVRGLRPDFRKLLAVEHGSAIVTAPATTPGFDFVSRFFVPVAGIDEDPVTGSAHCSLGPFWGQRLGKAELAALQVSNRGGVLKVALAGDRVKISGQAITVFRADILSPS
jgi:PhzF family phenazine biosynthesis protein